MELVLDPVGLVVPFPIAMHLERCSTLIPALIGIIGIHRPKIITHRIKLIVDVLASPAPHVPPVVDEAADVEVRGVHEPAVVRKLTGGYGI